MPKFQKRHYETVAKTFKKFRDENHAVGPEFWTIVLAFENDFARMFENDNPNFDSERFKEACKS